MNNYIKSPLNYIGGKGKLLKQIVPLLPNNIDVFYDIFCGGASVSLNVNANKIVCNDIVDFIIDMFNDIKKESPDSAVSKIESIVEVYNLSKTNAEGFDRLRKDYNNGKKTWDYLYTLICHSFNDQYRFNGKQEYNSSFGKDRSYFNDVKKQKLVNFIHETKTKDISFICSNFKDFNFEKIGVSDFVYLDPPYSITTGNYNDGKRGFEGWSNTDDIFLTRLLDGLTARGVKWAMSNVLIHKEKENHTLSNWLEENKDKYIVHHLNHSYNNCNYQTKDGVSDEVLICNYHKCGDCANYGDCNLDNQTCEYSL